MYIDKPKSYWDSLVTKDALYAEFEKMSSADETFIVGADPDLPQYYQDDEFEKVAGSVKDSVEKVLAVLPEVFTHFAEGADDLVKNKASIIMDDMEIDSNYGMALCAWVLYLALDTGNEKSFFKRLESGNGIIERRAACKAYSRYRAFKEEDQMRMLKFQLTPEYKMQQMELRLGLRDKIEIPEEWGC